VAYWVVNYVGNIAGVGTIGGFRLSNGWVEWNGNGPFDIYFRQVGQTNFVFVRSLWWNDISLWDLPRNNWTVNGTLRVVGHGSGLNYHNGILSRGQGAVGYFDINIVL